MRFFLVCRGLRNTSGRPVSNARKIIQSRAKRIVSIRQINIFKGMPICKKAKLAKVPGKNDYVAKISLIPSIVKQEPIQARSEEPTCTQELGDPVLDTFASRPRPPSPLNVPPQRLLGECF